jgi:hypothetical protein
VPTTPSKAERTADVENCYLNSSVHTVMNMLSNGTFSRFMQKGYCVCYDPMRIMVDVRGFNHAKCELPITDDSYKYWDQ